MTFEAVAEKRTGVRTPVPPAPDRREGLSVRSWANLRSLPSKFLSCTKKAVRENRCRSREQLSEES